jgi:nucleotide-binding universal stress UspA family protein
VHVRSICLIIDAGMDSSAAVDVAAHLASRFSASVDCTCAPCAPAIADGFAIGAAAEAAVIDRRDNQVAVAIQAGKERFLACFPDGDALWTSKPGYAVLARAVSEARLADLIILPQPDRHDEHGLGLAHAMLLETGVPCLIVPRDAPAAMALGRIAVAWSETAESRRALGAALPILEQAGATHIIEISASEDEACDQSLGPIAFLARHGITATRERRRGDCAEEILRACNEVGADLLVQGAYGHGRLNEAWFGGVTRQMLLHAPLPVLMAN